MVTLLIVPVPLLVFGISLSFLYLGGDLDGAPDSLTQSAALSYGVPALLAGIAMAMFYRRAAASAVETKMGFGRFLPLAVIPMTSAIFGLVTAFFIVSAATTPSAWTATVTNASLLAAVFSCLSGLGALLGAWLVLRRWSIESNAEWPKALAASGRSGLWMTAFFAFAMASLGEWLIVLVVAALLVLDVAVAVVLSLRAKRRRGLRAKAP